MKKTKLYQKGFTLIELLIVIALLGALAVGLLAAIDPLEQIRKGADSSNRNTVEEVHNSLARYYAVKTKFPWDFLSDVTGYGPSSITEADASDYLQAVIDMGELKDDFYDLVGSRASDISIYSEDEKHVSVCFQPISKSFLQDANTRYDASGVARTDCTSLAGQTETDCQWCVK